MVKVEVKTGASTTWYDFDDRRTAFEYIREIVQYGLYQSDVTGEQIVTNITLPHKIDSIKIVGE